jgi:hypothetical protein
VVEGCGDPEADLLLQQGITSLEDLSECQSDLLSSLPGIDEAGAQSIKSRAAELAVQKAEEEARQAEEDARLAAEAAAAEAAAIAAAQAAEEAPEDTPAEAEAGETVDPAENAPE